MSARYRAACHQEMGELVPLLLDWYKTLPTEQRYLFVGLKVGWESSIGVNAWYCPNGNTLLSQPEKLDPTSGLSADQLPGRGVVQLGYAAVKTAGLRREGAITEGELAEVVRRHLEDLSHEAVRLGVPRDHLFTHAAGWKESELLYHAAVNEFSCPGWSFTGMRTHRKRTSACSRPSLIATRPIGLRSSGFTKVRLNVSRGIGRWRPRWVAPVAVTSASTTGVVFGTTHISSTRSGRGNRAYNKTSTEILDEK